MAVLAGQTAASDIIIIVVVQWQAAAADAELYAPWGLVFVKGDFVADADSAAKGIATRKNHYAEAIVLASKVQQAPGIVGEICISDDPEYVTGYVASHTLGYRRISHVKEAGDPAGGRIFLFRGTPELAAECIDYLQNRPVLVEGIPETPPVPAR